MNRRKFAAAGSAALVAPFVLAGESVWSAQPATPESAVADVPMFRGDAAHTGRMPGPAPRGEPKLLWRFETGESSLRSSPVVAGGLVYIASDAGVLHALDLLSGSEHWQVTIFGTYGNYSPATFDESTPAVVDSVVYVSGWPDLLALDARSGEELWRQTNEGGGSPVVVDGVLYVRKGSLLGAFDAATGDLLWRFSAPNSGLVLSRSEPAVAGETAYVGIAQTLYAVNIATGEERWRFEAGFDLHSSPAVAGGAVFFGSGHLAGGQEGQMGHVFALDAETGAERWRLAEDGPFWPSPAVANGTVYIGGGLPILGGQPKGAFHALDAEDGSVRWTAPSGPIASSAVVVDGVVYTGAETEEGTTGAVIRGFDAENGDEVWRAELWTSFEVRASGFSSPAITDGVMLVGGGTTPALYAIGGELTEDE